MLKLQAAAGDPRSNAAKLRSAGGMTAGGAERVAPRDLACGCGRLLLEDRRCDGVRQLRLWLSLQKKSGRRAAPLRMNDQSSPIKTDGENLVPNNRQPFIAVEKDPFITDIELSESLSRAVSRDTVARK